MGYDTEISLHANPCSTGNKTGWFKRSYQFLMTIIYSAQLNYEKSYDNKAQAA